MHNQYFLTENCLNFVAGINYALNLPFLTPVLMTRQIQYM